MAGPTKLSNHPWVAVRIECSMCSRKGCYRLARLAAMYGPELSLDRLLSVLASSCPYWNERPRKYEPRCGAYFVDLERNLPPIDDPQEAGKPIYRTKEPTRESFEAYQRHTAAMRVEKRAEPAAPKAAPHRAALPSDKPEPMLSDWPRPAVRFKCSICLKADEFDKDTLMALGDKSMSELQAWWGSKCKHYGKEGSGSRCWISLS